MGTFKKLFASIAAVMIVVSTAPVAVFGQTSWSQEYQDAYAYAYANGITTMSSIDAANLAGTTTRAQAAKMFVEFAKSMGQTADTSASCSFSDLASVADTDLEDFAVEACQMGLMGIGTNGIFNPMGVLSRAEFGTVLSRVLFGDVYNGGNPFYAAHLNALNQAGLMNDLSNPERSIMRGDAMLLLYRSSTADLEGVTPAFCQDIETVFACTIDPDGSMGLCPAACIAGEEGEEEVTPNPLQGDGMLQVSNVSTFVNGTTIPRASATVVGKVMVSASADDVALNSITLKHGGFGDRTDVSVALYIQTTEGMTSVSNKRNVSSEDLVVLNLTSPVVVKKGGSETILVVVDTSAAAGTNTEAHTFTLEKAGIVGNALSIGGTFPIAMPSFKIANVDAGEVTFSSDGSLPSIKLGDAGAVVSKFKAATDNEEDISISSLTFRRATASDIQDSDLENFKLYINGNHVASSSMMKARKVTLTLATPFVIEKNKSNVKFELRADVVGGANRTVSFYIEDALAQGNKYNAGSLFAGLGSANPYGSATIEAGAISLEKVNAANDKLKKNTKKVEFGTIKITSNSSTAELEDIVLTIDSVNDGAAGAFVQVENLELYNKTNGSVFDLAYVAGTTSKTYESTDLGLLLQQGVVHEFVVRADTLTTSTNGDYIVSIANASTDMTVTELSDGIQITDITPNAVVLKKVQIEEPAVTFSQNLLSSSFTAVIGSEVEVMNFNIKPTDAENVVLREMKFDKVSGTATLDNNRVSGFNLYRMNGSGDYELVKSVGTNQLAAQEVTFPSINATLAKGVQHRFKLTVNLVKNSSGLPLTFAMGISDYDLEDAVDAEAVFHDGVFAAVSDSNRVVTITDAGTLSAAVYTSETPLNLEQNVLGNSTSDFVAAYELTALNEPILIKDLNMVATVAVGDLVDGVKEVILYANDKTTEIARRTVTADTVVFNNINYEVAQGTQKVWLKVATQRIGLNHPGSAVEGIEFSLDVVNADGADSDVALGAVAATADSTPFNVYPVNVSNVAVNQNLANEVLTDGGSTLVARVAITASSTTNTRTDNGATLKTVLETLRFSPRTMTNLAAANANQFTLERVSPLNGAANSKVATAQALATAADLIEFDLTTGFGNNNEVAGTVIFEVYAQVDVDVDTSNAYLELQLRPGDDAVEFGSDEAGAEGHVYVLNETLRFGQLRYNPN